MDSLGAFENRNNIYIKKTAEKGMSIFAKRGFRKGEVVYLILGPIVKRQSIFTVPIDYNLYIDPLALSGRETCHSCDPNCGIMGRNVVVAMKDIDQDDEVTIDYAMIGYAYGQEMTEENRVCRCGANNCRGKLGCYSEASEELKNKYEGYISDYLLKPVPEDYFKKLNYEC